MTRVRVDRWTTRLAYGSDDYVRELELFPTDQEAVTYVEQLRELNKGCPTDDQNGSPPTFTTDVNDGSVGDESVVITRASDGIGRVVINVVRVGNAVVVDLASDEGNGDTVIDLATVTRENLADVIAAMNELQGGSATPAPTCRLRPRPPRSPTTSRSTSYIGAPAVPDSETTIEGPGSGVEGVRAQTACGATLPMPSAADPDLEHEMGYSVSAIEGFEGRTLRAYPTVQDAVDRMAELRADLQGCDRDNDGDGLSDRLWRTFNNDTGYDSETFGYTYEIKDGVGAPAGQLYTVLRVGNAILAIEWSGEYSAEYQEEAAPDQVELAQIIGNDMCLFSVKGC